MSLLNPFHLLCFSLLVISAQQIFPGCKHFASAQVLHQGCLEKCGDIEIPYPFGTTKGCCLDSNFLMSCREHTSGPPRLFFGNSYTLEVINISLTGHLTVLTFVGKDCFYRNGSRVEALPLQSLVTLPYFPLSNTKNKFFAVGCDTHATIGTSSNDAYRTGCISQCTNQSLHSIVYDGTCSGLGCCQTTIPINILKSYVSVTSYKNHSGIWEYNPCSYVFVAESNYFKFSQGDLQNVRKVTKVPTVLDWAVGYETCETARNLSDYACGNNSICADSLNGPGYRCSCSEGYHGNPYMPNGCQVIPSSFGDNKYLRNSVGNDACQRNGKDEGRGCHNKKTFSVV